MFNLYVHLLTVVGELYSHEALCPLLSGVPRECSNPTIRYEAHPLPFGHVFEVASMGQQLLGLFCLLLLWLVHDTSNQNIYMAE
jgi:hypothetical protein